MVRFTNPYPLIALIGVLLTFNSLTLQAQGRVQYAGPKQLGDYNGDAKYSYKIVEGDTLLDGPFIMQRSNLQALLDNEDTSFLFRGELVSGVPAGRWFFQFGSFTSESESEVVDYQYRVQVSGTQEKAQGLMLNGRPEGPWTYRVDNIENSQAVNTLFRSQISFSRGLPQEVFRIETDSSTMLGRLLRTGMAHDEWVLYRTDESGTQESWLFEDGILRQVIVESDGVKNSISVYKGPVSMSKTIELDERYLQLLPILQPALDSVPGRHIGIRQSLIQNSDYYQKIHHILSGLGNASFKPSFKVRVAHFPMDSLETTQLDSAITLIKKASMASQATLEDTQLNILKLSDAEADQLFRTAQELTTEPLRQLEKLISYKEKGILEFVSRQQLLQRIWPDNDRPSVGDAYEQGEGAQIKYLLELASQTAARLETVQQQVNDKLSKQRREQEFITLEERLIVQIKALEQVADSLDTLAAPTVKNAMAAIVQFARSSLANYSAMEETDAKLMQARELTACFDVLELLARSVGAQPGRQAKLQEVYQDAIWNPFMATIMNEEIKKRLTNAYNTILIPYLLNKVANNLSCSNAGELTSMLGSAYQRMLQLRDEDTSKLERRLRREQDPAMVLELLNLDPPPEN